jgi:amidophosphoribosyltransferase
LEECPLHEECAVFGISLRNPGETATLLYDGLLSQQHRGQEGAGIAVAKSSKLVMVKNIGLVTEVFDEDSLATMADAQVGIGHCRYSTTGSNVIDNVQPFVTEYLTGRTALAHNGNILNAQALKTDLKTNGLSFSGSSDSEVISSLIAFRAIQNGDILDGIRVACSQLVGAFCLLILTGNGQLIALRDPSGFRPLCLGENESGMAVASETCALDRCGFRFLRDVQPGEMVLIENGKVISSQQITGDSRGGLCIFEYVYFSRPDSIVDGLPVVLARNEMGRVLAREHPVDADIVCSVPDSGTEAALGYSQESGIPYETAFVKNRYIGRSFIFPTQAQRERAVRLKLNPLRACVEGKRVVLVDDSIVRGTTCARIISSLRDAGAAEIHMRISSPPFRHPCHFGTDIDSEDNLIANQMTHDEIVKYIGADSLGYTSTKGLQYACRQSKAKSFCMGCFTGEYGLSVVNIIKNELEGALS